MLQIFQTGEPVLRRATWVHCFGYKYLDNKPTSSKKKINPNIFSFHLNSLLLPESACRKVQKDKAYPTTGTTGRVVKCAHVLVRSSVRKCAIAPGSAVPVCGSVPGVPVCRFASVWQCARCASPSLESSIHRGASAPPGACAAYPPATGRCAFKEGGGVGLGGREISDLVPMKMVKKWAVPRAWTGQRVGRAKWGGGGEELGTLGTIIWGPLLQHGLLHSWAAVGRPGGILQRLQWKGLPQKLHNISPHIALKQQWRISTTPYSGLTHTGVMWPKATEIIGIILRLLLKPGICNVWVLIADIGWVICIQNCTCQASDCPRLSWF